MILESIIFCFVMVGMIVSEIMMWQHVSGIRKKIDKMFEDKSAEEIYNFINEKANVKNSEDTVGGIKDK